MNRCKTKEYTGRVSGSNFNNPSSVKVNMSPLMDKVINEQQGQKEEFTKNETGGAS